MKEIRPPADPLVGWRYWQLSADARGLRSVSLRRFLWEPQRPMRASCMTGGHQAPAEGCDCGIYAAADLDKLRSHGLCLSPGGLVVGQVSLWGAVVVGEDGYRGQHALPRTLSLVEGTVPRESRSLALESLAAFHVPVSTTRLDDAVGELSGAVLANLVMSLGTGATPG
ncbi:MAG: hypothetical protein M3N28_06570 [Actinomycetota bacterium]|nr:hypothetical protein [Actinomycetota bacterium]